MELRRSKASADSFSLNFKLLKGARQKLLTSFVIIFTNIVGPLGNIFRMFGVIRSEILFVIHSESVQKYVQKSIEKSFQKSICGSYKSESITASGFSCPVAAKLVTSLSLEALSLTGFGHNGISK